MGLLDPTLLGNLNKLKGLLGETPIGKYVRGQDQGVSVNGLKQALLGMPVFDQRAGEQDMAYAADAIGPQAIGLMGKIVYHGSPHKFDKFDASKIGTGEGAQAYGHGVYLADAEDVAGSYAGMRPMAGAFTKNGQPWVAGTYAEAMAESRLRAGKGYDATIEKATKEADSAIASRNHEEAQRAQDIVAALKAMKSAGVEPNTGSLYKADLPDEWIPKMLDWDKPLSQQPENVRLLAKDLGLAKDATGKDVYSALSNQARDMGIIRGQNAQTTLPGSQGRAATDLAEFGIPGIRYLDGGSRGKGQGSYNYVVFPGLEDQVKILERNGIPINDGLLGRK